MALFVEEEDRHVNPLGVKGLGEIAWQSAGKKIGLPQVRVRDLRHTFATRLRAAGG